MGGRVDSTVTRDAVIAASLDGVGLLEDGAFVTANDRLAASFGYKGSDALVGVSWTELYPEAERERIEREILPSVRADRGWRGEVMGRRADGSNVAQVLSIRQTENGRLAWVVRARDEPFSDRPIQAAT